MYIKKDPTEISGRLERDIMVKIVLINASLFFFLTQSLLYAQNPVTHETILEQTSVSFDAPIPKDSVVKIQDRSNSNVPFGNVVLRAKSAHTVDVGFPITIVFSDELINSPMKDVAGDAMVLATTAYGRVSRPEMLETEHMKSVTKNIGIPKSGSIRIDLAPDGSDGKQRILVKTIIRRGNMRLLHHRPEIWRLEKDKWVLEDKGSLVSMSL